MDEGLNYTLVWHKSLSEAEEAARFLGYNQVNPGCILIGLLRTGESCLADVILRSKGVKLAGVVGAVCQVYDVEAERNKVNYNLSYDGFAVKVVEQAKAAGAKMRHSYRSTEHLLCGLSRVSRDDQMLYDTFKHLGVDGGALEADVKEFLCPSEVSKASP